MYPGVCAHAPGLHECIKLCIFFNVFFETTSAVFIRFHIGPSVERIVTIYSNVSAPLNKMAIMPIYGKTKKYSSSELRKLRGWILIYSTRNARSTNFVQMIVVGWPLTFLRQGQICAPIYLYGENAEKSFSQNVLKTNGWNLWYMIKIVKLFNYNQNFVPSGCVPLPLGYIIV